MPKERNLQELNNIDIRPYCVFCKIESTTQKH